jgi:hypothetical protein
MAGGARLLESHMGTGRGRVVVVVRPGRRTGVVLRWLRQLLPAAVLLVTPATAPAPEAEDGDVLLVESDEVDSPLQLADLLARGQPGVHGP